MRNPLKKIATTALFAMAAISGNLVGGEAKLPKEVLVFKLPQEEKRVWIINNLSMVSEYLGVVNMVPEGSLVGNDSPEELSVNFYGLEKRAITSVDQILDETLGAFLKNYPESKYHIDIIQKTDNDLLYECIAFPRKKKDSVFQVLVRFCLTPAGSHCISFTHRGSRLIPEEREQWLSALQNQVSLQSREEAKTPAPGTISLALGFNSKATVRGVS